MSFYSDFSIYYDQIFPVSNQTIDCFVSTFKPMGKILDIGCGSGGYAIELAKKGYRVDAIDFDEGMIQIAKQKIKGIKIPVHFKQGDMLALDQVEDYDGIYCIGNTLAHLNTTMDVFKALGNFYDALKPEGIFVFQIVNYDRVIDKNINSLPTLKAPGVEFIRNYELVNGKIIFKPILITEKSTHHHSVELLPIRQSELFKMMTQVGFHEVRSFGRFDASPFENQTSFMLVMTGKKS